MAHFAQLDVNNTVVGVLVVSNDDIGNLPFPESEQLGIAFLEGVLPGWNWAQTSYNGNFRVRYAGVGYTFVRNSSASPHGGFAPPKPHASWLWNDANCDWVAPVPYPSDGKDYWWDEEKQAWAGTTAPANPVTMIG